MNTAPTAEKDDWVIHNPLRGWTLQGLKAADVQLIISIFTTAEAVTALFWREGWAEWELLSSEKMQGLGALPARKISQTLPPIPSQFVSDSEIEVTQVRSALKKEKKVLDRQHLRYAVSIACDIIVGGHLFPAQSKDISLGGFCFDRSLPEWVTGYFSVVIKADPNIEVTCSIVEDQRQQRVRAEIVGNMNKENLKILENWLTRSGFPILPA